MPVDPKEQKRVHGIEAAGAGELGPVSAGAIAGPCPSCSAELTVGEALNPSSGRIERTLQHPVPFCSYFGETDADEIEREIEARCS